MYSPVMLAMYRGPHLDVKAWIVHIAICIRTLSWYSHCELVIHGVCWSASPRDGGVRGKVIDLDSGHWSVFPIDGADADYALAYFKARRGWKYSWRGFWRYVLPFVKQKPNEALCGQICAGALKLPNPESYSPQKLLVAIF